MNSDKDLSSDSTSEKVTPTEALSEKAKVKEPSLAQAIPEGSTDNPSTSGTMVLQWLTYALWGWTIVGVAYLISITATFVFEGGRLANSFQEPVAYGIAAVLVLLPVSLLCDIFYSRQEVEHKKGASSVIMVIHAVLFALFAIGTLIAAVFSFVNIFLSGYHTSPQVILVTATSMFVLYVLTLIRTVKPFEIRKLRFIYRIVMSIIVLGVCVWGIVGPVAATAMTKDDRAVSEGLTTVSTAISSFTANSHTLPKDINQIIDSRAIYGARNWDTTKDLANRGLVTYTPNTTPPAAKPADDLKGMQSSYKTYYYELCGVFKYAANEDSYSSYSTLSNDGYSSYPRSTNHTAGKSCYKLKAVDYSVQN